MSILGGIQPRPLSAYLGEAFEAGRDDGFMQRFQLLVWPDVALAWRNVDRAPDAEARRRVVELFLALDRLDLAALGAQMPEGGLPFLRFTPEAQSAFDAWRTDLELLLRGETLAPVLVSHLSKYRSLCPSLALLFHVIDCLDAGRGGLVSLDAITRAIAWCAFLRPHAERVYSGVLAPGRAAAAALAPRLAAGALPDPFTARDVARRGWAGALGTGRDCRRAGPARSLVVDPGRAGRPHDGRRPPDRALSRQPDGARGRPTGDGAGP